MNKVDVSTVDTVQAMGELLDIAALLVDDAAPVLLVAGREDLAARCRWLRDAYDALVREND